MFGIDRLFGGNKIIISIGFSRDIAVSDRISSDRKPCSIACQSRKLDMAALFASGRF
jgi:hypothetical protein